MLAGPFLKLWLGDFGTPELTATFRILLIAFAFPAFAMPVSNVLVASGVSGLSARFAWLTVVVTLGSMIWLIPGSDWLAPRTQCFLAMRLRCCLH
jgi:O-antigen/teichoic acid export membrane protein